MEPMSHTWINKETKLHNNIKIITRQQAKKMSSSENMHKSNQATLLENNHASSPTSELPENQATSIVNNHASSQTSNLPDKGDLKDLDNLEDLKDLDNLEAEQANKPDLKDDNLEDDIIATKLFKIVDFYPAGNIIEACIYSNNFASGKIPKGFPERNYPKCAIIQMWKK